MTSIRHQLLFWLLAGLALGLVLAAVGVYRQTREEANELFDYQLKQIAASLPNEAFAPLRIPNAGNSDINEDVVIQIWDRNGLQLYFSRPESQLPQRAEIGFSTVATERGQWRVYSALVRNNIVQVAQPISLRRELAADMALRTITPLLLMFPLLGALIWLTVGRGLRPLRQVADEVGERTAHALQPLGESGLPEEVRPLIAALNNLLDRLKRALDAQRAFVADAAHELRTPLTALQLQLQLAERAGSKEEKAAALAELGRGIDRASRLVQQLLTLARQEPSAAERAFTPVALEEISKATVSDYATLALDKGIDLGLAHEEPIRVLGDVEALRVMLGNLVDNALRYTPPGGTVDVSLYRREDKGIVAVSDTGPGIPEADRARVFDRFYRVPGNVAPGSGLGLAIVKSIADAHGAAIELANRENGRGLRVTIAFPLGDSEQAPGSRDEKAAR